MPYTFRPAVESDVQAIADIYNASVMAGGATADLTPRTFDQRRAWVEYADSRPTAFLLWNRKTVQSLASVRSPCFMTAQDVTVSPISAYYIDPAWQGRGVGTFILDRLLTEALARHMRKAC